MDISLAQAAEILTLSEDELMFLKQQGIIEAGISDQLTWIFNLDDVLALKAQREVEVEEEDD